MVLKICSSAPCGDTTQHKQQHQQRTRERDKVEGARQGQSVCCLHARLSTRELSSSET